MLDHARTYQAKQTLTHWQVTPSASRRVLALAQTVRAIRPGVYLVGSCIVDNWRGSCSCKSARRDQAHQCAHKLALRLAELVQCIPGGYTKETRAYFADAGIDQPQIIATYAQVKGHRGRVRVHVANGWVIATAPDGERFAVCPTDESLRYVSRLFPFYE